MTSRLTESFEDLTEWAKAHGPDYLKYAAERGFMVKSGTMDVVAERVAREFGGRHVRPARDLVRWNERDAEDGRWDSDLGAALRRLNDFKSLPARVELELTKGAQRVEEQPDPHDARRILKYTGFVITVRHPATESRYVVVNLEAADSTQKKGGTE